MDVDSAVKNFRDALAARFPYWEHAAAEVISREGFEKEEVFNDWAQCLWELLVERVVLEPEQSLEIYGAGTDYEGAAHSRVFFHNALPTHEVFLKPSTHLPVGDVLNGKSMNLEELQFDRLVSFRDGWFRIEPPFDHALVCPYSGDRMFVVCLDDVIFSVRPSAM